jgi:hypothetical protein
VLAAPTKIPQPMNGTSREHGVNDEMKSLKTARITILEIVLAQLIVQYGSSGFLCIAAN